MLFFDTLDPKSQLKRPTIKKEFYKSGKLLLSGEYAVLDGATALAVPTQKGQKMIIKNSRGSDLVWESIDHEGNVWFSSHISLYDFSAVNTTDQDISDHLQKVLKNAVRQNSEFLNKWNGFKVETHLEFPRDWGLGSSSTLYALIGEWADINSLILYFKIEQGSGYDVAVSDASTPILYFANDEEVSYTPVDFAPDFRKNIYFIHLNKKMDSNQGIKEYLKAVKKRKSLVKDITRISEEMADCDSLKKFAALMDEHEDLINCHTGFEKVKDSLFADYHGSIKSLGAWGGDFVMATSEISSKDTLSYFGDKGYDTCIPYNDLIKG